MIDSILNSTKHALGVGEDYDVFDPDLVMHINSALFNLWQIGIGPSDGFEITGDGETWEEFTKSAKLLNPVKSYVYIQVRLLFDPPQTSFLINALEERAKEYLWRLGVLRDELVSMVPAHDPTIIDGGQA